MVVKLEINKSFLMAVLLMAVLTLGAVSANDNLTADVSSVNSIDDNSIDTIGVDANSVDSEDLSLNTNNQVSVNDTAEILSDNGLDNVDVEKNTADDSLGDGGHFIDVSEAYTLLNNFRTQEGVWQWNEDNNSTTVFNTNDSNKLKPLEKDTRLEETARTRAIELVQSFSHTRPNGNDTWSAFPAGFSSKGENIAMKQTSCSEVTEAWKETDYLYEGQGHRRNMLNGKFNCVGIAGYELNGTIYWVQDFGYTENIVTKYDSVMTVEVPQNITYGSDVNVTVTLAEGATGNVTVSVDGTALEPVEVVNSSAAVPLTNLAKGTHTVNVTYSGDNEYLSDSKEVNITVTASKTDANMTVEVPENIKYGSDVNVTVTLDVNATGNVTVSVDGTALEPVEVVNGSAIVPLTNLTEGTHTINVVYSGDDEFASASKDVNVTVSKTDANMTADIPEKVQYGKDANITVTLAENATGNVTLNVDGKDVKTVSVVNGTATLPLTNLTEGNHNVSVTYSGDDEYASATKEGNVTVSKLDPEMNVNVPEKIFIGENTNVTVTMAENATGNITVTVDGKNATVVEVVNGTAVVPLNNLTLGTHTIEVAYSGDDNYKSEIQNATVKVREELIKTVLSGDGLVMYVGDNSTFNVTLTDGNGNPIAGKGIKLRIVGKEYTAITDENGVAKWPIGLKPGLYSASVIFKGDDTYEASDALNTSVEVKTKVRIDQNKNLVKDYHDDAKPFTVRTLDKYGKPAANQYVKMTVSGKTYTVKSNGNGIATLPINLYPGTYKITSEYAGYKVSNTITVKEVIHASNRQWKAHGSYSYYTAILKHSDGKVIKGKTVYFSVAGKTYKAVTNAKGEATISLKNLGVGKYTILVKYIQHFVKKSIIVK